jgi:L-lactate utilization protein LutB
MSDEARRLATFIEAVNAAGGTCVRVPSLVAAAEAIHTRLRAFADAQDTPAALHIGYSDAPIVHDLIGYLQNDTATSPSLHAVASLTSDALFALDVGVTGVQWGVAETGTLVLSTAGERNRLLSLIPALHIAIVHRRDVRDTLTQVLHELHAPPTESPRHAPAPPIRHRAVTFITGPSRTSDIELTLVVGVHGPTQLYVVLLDDSSPVHS